MPKTDWINVGAGTVDPNEVRAAWQKARAHFSRAGHVPPENAPELDAMKGHAYYLYDPAHLDGAARVDADGKGGAYLVGDALGLSQPLTAEGILPAVLSGRLLAEAILEGAPASYPARLRAHPILVDYRRVFRLREAASALGARPARVGAAIGGARRRAIASGFAWMFSGARLPAPRLIDLALAVADRWPRKERESGRAA